MTKANEISSRWVAVGTCAAFVVGAGLGHLYGRQTSLLAAAEPKQAAPIAQAAPPKHAPAVAAPVQPAAQTVSADGTERYQVPVTMSQPAKGPEDAIVTLVEWCDVQGEKCRTLEPVLAQILAKYPTEVRLVFRHFKGSTPGSGDPHEFTRIAHEQAGKFWEAKDLLLKHEGVPTREDYASYSKQLGMDWKLVSDALEKHTYSGHIAADRVFAGMFSVAEVPAVFINGRKLSGEPTFAALKTLIDDELARATKLVAKGIPKDQVYAELTKDGLWKRPEPGSAN